MDRIPIKTNPKLFDLAVSQLQTALGDNLPWLDYSFGLCERLTDIKDGRKFHSANLYLGGGRYEQIMPCDELGNFSFFYLRDTQNFSTNERVIKSPFSLIIWYNLDKVSLATDERNREAIKEQILGILKQRLFSSWLTLSKIYEKTESIFADFSYEHTNNQFLMSPYAGLRIDGEIKVIRPCEQLYVETWYLKDKNALYLCDKNSNRLIYKH